jgi:hypothetical protein
MHRWAHLLKEQTLIMVHRLPTKKNKLPFSVSIFVYIYIYILKWQHIYTGIYIQHIYRYRYKDIDIYTQYLYIYMYIYICCHLNGKWKPWRFSLIRLPFAHRSNGSSSFVRLFTENKRKLPFAKD